MAAVLDPDVDEPAPPTDGGDDGDDPGQPWWHSPWRLLVLGLAVLFLGTAAGYAITSRSSTSPSASSVDVGFLQDMRWHHDQAVLMSLILLGKPIDEQSPQVRGMANDILLSQQFENGVMAGQLRSWGQGEANESGTGMTWMGMPVPIDRMPGMASEAQLDQLRAASGPAADQLFLDLMIAHHEGGLHMATDAAGRGTTGMAKTLANSVLSSQEFELGELRNLRQQLAA